MRVERGRLKGGRRGIFPRRYVTADAELRLPAERGNPVAQTELGAMYLAGHGVMKDDRLAVVWFRKAAEQGNVAGESNLGTMYLQGVGVPKDVTQGMVWLRKAAEQGDLVAESNLGDLYSHGQGVQRDYAQASIWYRRAAEHGDAISQANLGGMYLQGQGLPQDFAQAAVWLGKSAAQGNERAEYSLGLLYTIGKGVPKDYVQANTLIRKAVASGNNQALSSLAYLYANGLGVGQDLVIAYALSTLAIDPVRTGARPTFGESALQTEVARKMTPAQEDAAEKLIVQMQRNGVLDSLRQPERVRQGQIQVTLLIPDSTAQDAALLATQGIRHRRLVAASEFFGRYLLNTRARPEFCKAQALTSPILSKPWWRTMPRIIAPLLWYSSSLLKASTCCTEVSNRTRWTRWRARCKRWQLREILRSRKSARSMTATRRFLPKAGVTPPGDRLFTNFSQVNSLSATGVLPANRTLFK